MASELSELRDRRCLEMLLCYLGKRFLFENSGQKSSLKERFPTPSFSISFYKCLYLLVLDICTCTCPLAKRWHLEGKDPLFSSVFPEGWRMYGVGFPWRLDLKEKCYISLEHLASGLVHNSVFPFPTSFLPPSFLPSPPTSFLPPPLHFLPSFIQVLPVGNFCIFVILWPSKVSRLLKANGFPMVLERVS